MLAAPLAWILAGCSVEQPPERTPATRAAEPQLAAPASDPAPPTTDSAPAPSPEIPPKPQPAPGATGASTAEPGPPSTAGEAPASVQEAAPVEAQAPAAPRPSPIEPAVRDAKEATEEATRRIIDATVGAAAKIKEVGMSAVQTVRDTVGGSGGPAADPDASAAPADPYAPNPVEGDAAQAPEASTDEPPDAAPEAGKEAVAPPAEKPR